MTEPVELAKKAFNGKKLAMADRIRKDGRLTSSTRMIGAELCSLVNFHQGYAFAPEKYFAEQLCVNLKTVKRAVAMLQEAGYFQIEKTGRSNRYHPVFEPAEQGTICPPSEIQQGTICPLSGEDGGQKSPEQGTKTAGNRGQKRPPISLETSFGSQSPGATGRVGAPDGAAAPASNSDQLGGFAPALEAKVGRTQFQGWLRKVAFVSEIGSTLTLAAPNQFIADHVKNFFGGDVLAVWKAERPQIERLEIIVATALGAAPPSKVASIAERRGRGDADAQWLLDQGVDLVCRHLRDHRQNVEKHLVSWLRRCGNDAAGLRRIITEASEQQLHADQFANVVKQRTKQLLHADQQALPLKPVAVTARRA